MNKQEHIENDWESERGWERKMKDRKFRPYSQETFWHTILRYCNKKILWFQSIDFYLTTKVSS